jgi:mannose-6-phosphate isomerase
MGIQRLERHAVERIWGRRDLPAGFADCAAGAPIGEVWFGGGPDDALLVKYLFTSERLSIQVHPGDEAARAAGYPHGKDEAWLVLDAEPGAVIGLGLKRRVTKPALRAAALDGSIENLVDWRPAKRGDALFSPAGTIHAIGAGLTLIEVQQNIDLTYRLYDYGRPRELHLEAALAVAQASPWRNGSAPFAAFPGRCVLAGGGPFTLERWTRRGRFRIEAGGELLLIPLKAMGTIDGEPLAAGTVWRLEGEGLLELPSGADLLAAYPGPPLADPLGEDQSLVLRLHSSGKARLPSVDCR